MTFSPFERTLSPTRAWLSLGLLAIALCEADAAGLLAADSRASGGLVSNEVAAQYGLERAWFSQVRVDPARFRVATWTLDKDQLFALTTDGTIQAISAETGETLWITDIASRNATAIGLAVNANYIAVLSAARLHLLDRSDGRLRWSREIGGAPSSAPAMGNRYAYVALLNGRIEGYELEKPTASVWQYQSSGRSFHSLATTGNVVSWPTDEGYLYVSSLENPQPLFRIHTNAEIVTAPAELAPFLYVASQDGYLYCFHEFTGKELWRYATGFAVTSKPAIVGEMAFVTSEETAIHAIDRKTGNRIWRIDGVADFVALGANYVYGLAPYGTLVLLDKETGRIAGRIPTTAEHKAIVNDQSDRIFLVSGQGSVQCLREMGASQPTWYRQPEDANKQEDEEEDDAANPFSEDAPAAEQETPGTEEGLFNTDAAEVEGSPFDTEEPAGVFDEDNPF